MILGLVAENISVYPRFKLAIARNYRIQPHHLDSEYRNNPRSRPAKSAIR